MKFDFAIAPVDAVVLVFYLIGVVLFGVWVGAGSAMSQDTCSAVEMCRGGLFSDRSWPRKRVPRRS